MIEQTAEQGFSHLRRSPEGGLIGDPAERRPKQRQGDEELYPASERSEAGGVEGGVIDDAGQGPCEGDDEHPARHPRRNRDRKRGSGGGAQGLEKGGRILQGSLRVAMPAQEGAAGSRLERHPRAPA